MADEADAAQWAVVLWDTKPGTVDVVPRKDVRINEAGEGMAKWKNKFWKIKKILAESDDLQYIAKLDFSPEGILMPKRGRPSKKAFTSFDQSLLTAKSISDRDDDDGLLADEIAGIDADAEDEEDSEADVEENETETGKGNARNGDEGDSRNMTLQKKRRKEQLELPSRKIRQSVEVLRSTQTGTVTKSSVPAKTQIIPTRNDEDLDARRNDKGDEQDATVREDVDGLRKFKRYQRINHIYEISEGETEDEHEIERKTKRKRKSLDDGKEYSLLPSARRRGREIEIYPKTDVFIKKRLLRNALQQSGNKPGDFVCELMRSLLGDKLKTTSVQGGGSKEAFPKPIYNAVKWAINSLVQKDDRMDESEYKRCVTQLCTRSRVNRGKKGKKTEEKVNRAAEKDVITEVIVDEPSMTTADQSGDNLDHIIPEQVQVIPEQVQVIPEQVPIIPEQVEVIPEQVQIIPEQVQKRPAAHSNRDKILEYPASDNVTGGTEGLKDTMKTQDETEADRPGGLKDTRSGKNDTRESSQARERLINYKDTRARRSSSRLTDWTNRESVERRRDHKNYAERRSKHEKRRVTRSRSRSRRRDDRRRSSVRDSRGESRSRDHRHRYAVSGSTSRYGKRERESEYYGGGHRSRR